MKDRPPWQRLSAASAILLAAATMAGCGATDEPAPGSTAARTSTTALTGAVTSPSAAVAPFVSRVRLSSGSTAVVGTYPPGTSSVRTEVGDLVAFTMPTAREGMTWKAVGGTARGRIAELAGSGMALVAGADEPRRIESFTYRVTAVGRGTLEFRQVDTRAGDGPPQPGFSFEQFLVVTR